MAKPDTKLFEKACVENGVKPEDCWYIGDDIETDIIPCEKSGMHGVWIDRTNRKDIHSDICTIRSLCGLRSVITAL